MVPHRLIYAAFFCLSSSASLAGTSKDTLISGGSFFAAAIRCENLDQISKGQSQRLVRALNGYLSRADRRFLKAGLIEGEKRAAVYLAKEKHWESFAADEAACARVQAVLDEYKTNLISE